MRTMTASRSHSLRQTPHSSTAKMTDLVPTEQYQLQLCLNKIEKWAMENVFKFSNSKTLGMHFIIKEVSIQTRSSNYIIPLLK